MNYQVPSHLRSLFRKDSFETEISPEGVEEMFALLSRHRVQPSEEVLSVLVQLEPTEDFYLLPGDYPGEWDQWLRDYGELFSRWEREGLSVDDIANKILLGKQSINFNDWLYIFLSFHHKAGEIGRKVSEKSSLSLDFDNLENRDDQRWENLASFLDIDELEEPYVEISLVSALIARYARGTIYIYP